MFHLGDLWKHRPGLCSPQGGEGEEEAEAEECRGLHYSSGGGVFCILFLIESRIF